MSTQRLQLYRLDASDRARIADPIAGIALSGGGSHGAFAAGILHTAYARFLDEGRVPRVRVIAGTSTGALVAGLLCQFYGRYKQRRSPEKSLEDLRRVYTSTPQGSVGYRPGLLGLFFNLLTKKGVMDVSPLRELIREHFEPHHMADALADPHPVSYVCNFIDMVSGQQRHIYSSLTIGTDARESAHMHAAIFASCAQPVVMTPAYVDERWAVDGGVREVIPFREAMRQKCTSVLAVALNEPDIDPDEGMVRATMKNPLKMIERGLEVMNDEVARDDERLAWMTAYINRARDEIRPHVSDEVFRKAFPPDLLPRDVDAKRRGHDDDPYENGIYSQSLLRDILLFRFDKRDLPKTDEFGEVVLSKLFADGVKAANAHMDEIRETLFVGGSL